MFKYNRCFVTEDALSKIVSSVDNNNGQCTRKVLEQLNAVEGYTKAYKMLDSKTREVFHLHIDFEEKKDFYALCEFVEQRRHWAAPSALVSVKTKRGGHSVAAVAVDRSNNRPTARCINSWVVRETLQ